MRLRVVATIGLFSGLIGLANTQAAAIYNSFGNSPLNTSIGPTDVIYPDAIQHAGDGSQDSGGLKVAYEFTPNTTTGSTSYDIVAAVFSQPAGLVGNYNNPGGASAVTLQIFSDSAGEPTGSAVSSQSSVISTQPFSASDTSKMVNGTVSVSGTLTAGTPYWLVIAYSSPAGGGNVARSYEGNPASSGSYAYFHGDSITGAGAAWSSPALSGNVGAFSITPVPEPQAYAMMVGLALLGFVVFRRFCPKAA